MFILHEKIRVVITSPDCYIFGVVCYIILDLIEIMPASPSTYISCGFHTVAFGTQTKKGSVLY